MAHLHHRIDYIELTVRSLREAMDFYHNAFGWTFNEYGSTYAGIIGADGEEVGGLLESGEPRSAGGPFVILYSTNLEESIARIVAAGGTIIRDPYEFPGGQRLHFHDPSGNELGVWTEAGTPA